MRKIYFLALIFALTSCLDRPFAQGVDPKTDGIFLNGKYKSTINITEFTPAGKQYYFTKVWGFLKYHGDFDDVNQDWDAYFLENILKVETMSSADYKFFINKTIALFPKPVEKQKKNNVKDYSLIDNSWFGNSIYFNNTTSDLLTYHFENYTLTENKFAAQNSVGTVDFKNENDYDDNDCPAENVRLLGMARYWNIINYFYVYKNHMTEDWDSILLSSLPKFANAETARNYHMATQELSSRLYDCHSMVHSQLLDSKIYGRNVTNFRTKLIDSTLIVKNLRVPQWDDGKIKTGDIILKIDGEDAIARYRRFNAILKGANPLSEQRIICPYLFSSVNKEMKLEILRNGVRTVVSLKLRDYSEFVQQENKIKAEQQNGQVLKTYPGNTAYINLDHITNSNFDDNFEAAKKYKNLIIDLRNYPNGKTTLNLSEFIMPKSKVFFNSSYADVTHPGMLRKKEGYSLGSNDSDGYKGNVYVLVNETTQSEAEFLVMALQTNPKTKVIGSRTAGSDGNVQEFSFPGKIQSVFTGIGIYYPDNTPTQRRGIKLDKEVNQTLKGIAGGRDEILEQALLQTGK